MYSSTLRSALLFLLLFLLALPLSAALVSVEPDLYADGTDLGTLFPELTLSAVGGGLGAGSDPASVLSVDLLTVSSTGTRVFGHPASVVNFDPQPIDDWLDGNATLGTLNLRIDFHEWVDFISIDVVGNDNGPGLTDFGFLAVYDGSDALLAQVSTAALSFGQIETLTLSGGSPSWAYAIASGLGGESVVLDNLNVNVVPEPSSAVLLFAGIAAIAIGTFRRRRIR